MHAGHSWFLYEIGYWLSRIGLALGFSYHFEGGRHIPRTGPALLIANHQSFLDPSIVGSATRRHLCFLARKTLFRGWFGKLINRLNAVPVDQEGVAKEGLKMILEQLNAGQAVLVFPEGERTATGEIQPLKPGILLLIKRMEAPIVPIGVAGAFDALPRTRHWPKLSPFFLPPTDAAIAVSVGQPIPAARYRDMPRDKALTELQEELERAKERAERLRRKG
ncbi:MAG TPA: lysophospholipid acyltransferase family protein [Gemmataceae bacterium]|nr:lysophospholipid acyltransferase family protein [Gemmataceae bacterium]